MSDLLEKCDEFFGTCDFYEVLKVSRSASLKEIKKAYYKLSLLVHPDRVDEAKKEIATEKFKVLGKVHSILQNADKKKIYDETGNFDEEYDSLVNWMSYWRNLFKKISTEDIENYQKEYIGSDTEKHDIKRAYVGTKGDMDRILEMVPFSNCDNEARIINIVKNMVDNGEVEEYSKFFNEPQKKKRQRKLKEEREKKRAEKLNISDNDLAEEIQNRQAQRMNNFLTQLEAKYGSNDKSAKQKNARKAIANKEATKRTRLARACNK